MKDTEKNETTALNSTTLNQPKPTGVLNTIGSLLPYAPLVFEQITGQKIPPMTGTLAEMNSSLSQFSLTLTQILNNQQQI
jgi:hypothetical protein